MKNIYSLLLVAVTLFSEYAIAQPTIKQQRTIGGNSSDVFQAMERTIDGGYLLAGYSESDSSFDKTQTNWGVTKRYTPKDFWIVKLDGNRNIEWNKRIGGTAEDQLTCLLKLKDGSFILGGTSSSNISGQKTQNSKGYNDYWIVKIDNKGNVLWDRTIGGSGSDGLGTIKQTTDGGFILAGGSNSDISGDKTESLRKKRQVDNYPDYWIVKTDSLGNVLWDRTYGGGRGESVTTIIQTADGGYLMGGNSNSDSSFEKSENRKGIGSDSDIWLVKVDSIGNLQWENSIGGNKYDGISQIISTEDGSYMLGATSGSNISEDKTETGEGAADFWIIKIDSQGNIIWDKTIGGSYQDYLTVFKQTILGGYILGGYSSSGISGDKTEPSRGFSDYWVVKLNKAGDILWEKTIGGNNNDNLTGLIETAANNFALCGTSYSDKTGDKNKPVKGKECDYWFVELKYIPQNNVVAALEPAVNNTLVKKPEGFKVYPNPVKDILNIQTSQPAVISLTDQNGKTIFIKNIHGNTTIDVAYLPAGLYLLKNNATGVVEKLVKMQ